MKNLANCKPSEFLKQTFRIKKLVESWLTNDEIKEIRNRMPKQKQITDDMTIEEKGNVMVENEKARSKQILDNFFALLDIMLDKRADETLSILALCCFVEPENVDDHEMNEYLDAISDLLENSSVIRFFTSLTRLGQTDSPTVSRA